MAASGTILSRNPRLSAVEMDGQTVMMGAERGAYFALDPVGAAVWDFLAKPASLDAIIAHVAQSFDAPDPEVLHRDLTEFVEDLLNQGLLRQADGQ